MELIASSQGRLEPFGNYVRLLIVVVLVGRFGNYVRMVDCRLVVLSR